MIFRLSFIVLLISIFFVKCSNTKQETHILPLPVIKKEYTQKILQDINFDSGKWHMILYTPIDDTNWIKNVTYLHYDSLKSTCNIITNIDIMKQMQKSWLIKPSKGIKTMPFLYLSVFKNGKKMFNSGIFIKPGYEGFLNSENQWQPVKGKAISKYFSKFLPIKYKQIYLDGILPDSVDYIISY